MKNNYLKYLKRLEIISNKLKEKLVVKDINYLKNKFTNPKLKINEIILYFKNRIFKDNNEAFLKQDTFWIKSVSWGIIGTSIFGIGWLALAKTEEIIVVPGKIVPIGEVKNIQMPMGGVAKNILVKEG